MRSLSLRRAWFGVVCALVVVTGARAAADPARLVFLLRYIGTDYEGAVQDGRVVDAFEYDEVLRFAREVGQAYAVEPVKVDDVVLGLQALERLIVERAPAPQVFDRTRALVPALAAALGVASAPAGTGNVATGAALYALACANCHGENGDGNVSEAAALKPPPRSLRDARAARLPVEQIYGAVTFGIEGTAMAAFRDVYDEQQRWDLAAFVASLAAPAAPAAAPGAGADAGLALALQLQDTFTRIAARVQPSVVGVTSFVEDPTWTLERLTAERGMEWIQAHTEELRFSGYRKVNAGSGVLVSDDGYVLTANHLIRDEQGEVANLVSVELRDGRHVKARVVGAEPTIDLGVLRLVELTDPKERNVPPVTLGDSDAVQVGNWVIAVGDPPGADVTYAVGTLAARPERQCYQEDLSRTLFQTSVAVPPESQGGPLLDVQGRAIGLTVQRPGGLELGASSAASSTYALPMNLVFNIYEALKVAQSDRSPWIGVSVLELASARRRLGTQARAARFPRTGVYIDDVFAPSPASRAGIRPGDFLVALGTHRVLSVGDFQKWLYLGGIGSEIEVELARGGKAVKYRLPIEVRPAEATTR
jgi:S1-C subfamily serine protease